MLLSLSRLNRRGAKWSRTPPDLRDDFAGCPFAPRCAYAFDPCATVPPELRELPERKGWLAACHLHDPAHGAPGFPSLEMTHERA